MERKLKNFPLSYVTRITLKLKPENNMRKKTDIPVSLINTAPNFLTSYLVISYWIWFTTKKKQKRYSVTKEVFFWECKNGLMLEDVLI